MRAASISFFTFNQGAWDGSVTLEGRKPKPGIDNDVFHNVVGPGYFAAMGLPLLTGRVFGLHDTANSSKVAVINETMAQEFFPDVLPIGQRFSFNNGHSKIEVVGVVKDVKYTSLLQKEPAAAYYPYTQPPAYYNDFESLTQAALVRSSRRSGALWPNRSPAAAFVPEYARPASRSVHYRPNLSCPGFHILRLGRGAARLPRYVTG